MEELAPSYQTGSTQCGGSRDSGWHGWVGSGCQGNGVWRLCLAWPGSWCSPARHGVQEPSGAQSPTINHLFTHGSLGEGAGMRSLLCKAQRRNGTWAQLAERVGMEEGTQPKRPGVGMVESNSTLPPGLWREGTRGAWETPSVLPA